MKSTGIIRKLYELGRIVLPVELRKNLDIKEKDPMEIHVENGKLVLEKFEPGCTFCNSKDHLKEINGKMICKNCISKIKNLD